MKKIKIFIAYLLFKVVVKLNNSSGKYCIMDVSFPKKYQESSNFAVISGVDTRDNHGMISLSRSKVPMEMGTILKGEKADDLARMSFIRLHFYREESINIFIDSLNRIKDLMDETT